MESPNEHTPRWNLFPEKKQEIDLEEWMEPTTLDKVARLIGMGLAAAFLAAVTGLMLSVSWRMLMGW